MTKAFELFKESLEKISDDDFAKILDEMENKELKIENHKLEQKLLKLYDEQAERTKKIAELNGIGG